MSEQAEGQKPTDTASRRKIVRLGVMGGIVALTKGILSDAKPVSAETPTPAKAPSTTPTATPSVKDLQTRTAKLFLNQTVQAGQLKEAEEYKKEAEEYKKAEATNTAQAKKIEETLGTPTPTPTATSTSTPTATSTLTAEQIELKRRGGLLPTVPAATESAAEKAATTPTPPPPPTSGGNVWGAIIPAAAAIAVVVGGVITKPWRIVKRAIDAWHGGAGEGTGDNTPPAQ